LNSKLLDFFWRSISTPMRGGYFRYFTQYIEQLPIPRINFAKAIDKARHDRMNQMVDVMLELHQELAESKVDQVKNSIQRQIDATDKQIDALVYELYGLTDEEIKIVERTTDTKGNEV
jgi:type II restriction/modification system DNA methylase subunit YeeA